MLENFKINAVSLNRQIKITIYLPDDYNRSDELYDVFYLLDGQNAFSHKDATYGKSLRACDYLDRFSKEYDKKIIGVGIHSPHEDTIRMNEYSPFKISDSYTNNNLKNNPQVCQAFSDFLISTIIPFISERYRCTNNKLIYGSSAGGQMALYLAVRYSDIFTSVASFSNCCFIMKDEYFSYLSAHLNINTKYYLYAGIKEDTTRFPYTPTAQELHSLLINNKAFYTRLIIDPQGEHNEGAWEKHLFDYLKFSYNIK